MKRHESFYKLIRETDIKEVVENVNRMYYSDKPNEKCPYAYKGAFDQLMQLEPESLEREEYAIHVYQRQYPNDDRPYVLTNCEGMKWKNALALPVVVEDPLELTSAETVAAILWALTFYGFSEKESKRFVEDLEKEAEEVGTILDMDEFEDDDEEEEEMLPLSPEEEEQRRLEERAQKVEYAMMELLSQSEGLTVKDLLYLLDTALICQIWPHTYAYDISKRMDYLIELIDSYSDVKRDFNRIALCITSSPEYPLTEVEENTLVQRLKDMVNGGQVLLAKRYHRDIEKELQAIILFSKD